MTTGTRRIFTEEHDMLRDMARKFFNERVVPFHAKCVVVLCLWGSKQRAHGHPPQGGRSSNK